MREWHQHSTDSSSRHHPPSIPPHTTSISNPGDLPSSSSHANSLVFTTSAPGFPKPAVLSRPDHGTLNLALSGKDRFDRGKQNFVQHAWGTCAVQPKPAGDCQNSGSVGSVAPGVNLMKLGHVCSLQRGMTSSQFEWLNVKAQVHSKPTLSGALLLFLSS